MHTVRSAEGSISQSRLDQWCIDYADSLSVEDQGEQVDFQFVDGATGRLRRGEILLHVANHKTYHRGYVAVVLYQLGGRPPVMDLPVFSGMRPGCFAARNRKPRAQIAQLRPPATRPRFCRWPAPR